MLRPKRTLNRRVGDTKYYKWLIADVPREDMEALGWDENAELTGEVRGDAYVIRATKRRD